MVLAAWLSSPRCPIVNFTLIINQSPSPESHKTQWKEFSYSLMYAAKLCSSSGNFPSSAWLQQLHNTIQPPTPLTVFPLNHGSHQLFCFVSVPWKNCINHDIYVPCDDRSCLPLKPFIIIIILILLKWCASEFSVLKDSKFGVGTN